MFAHRSTRRTLSLLLLVGAALACTPAAAQVESFELAKLVPADVHFYAGWRNTPARARITAAYCRAFQRLVHSGVAEDIFELATHDMPKQKRSEARAAILRVWRMVAAPKWHQLVQGEGALAFKLGLPLPEYVLLLKAADGSAARRYDELHTLLKNVAGMAPKKLSVSDTEQEGARVATLGLAGPPIALSLATKGDVVVLSTSRRLLDSVLKLTDAPKGQGGLVTTDRFRTALKGLPPAQDGLLYFDLAGYLQFFRDVVNTAGLAAGDNADAQGALSIAETVFDELQRLRLVAAVQRTEGDRIIADSRLVFDQTGGSGFIEGLIQDRESVAGAVKLVPKDASGFALTSGIDWEAVYDAILDLVGDRMPKGDQYLATWEQLQKKAGFHVRRDLLSWIDGSCGWICLRGRGANTGGVLLIRVKDADRTQALIDQLLGRAKKFLDRRGQRTRYVPLPNLDGDFREIRIATLPFFRPVIGQTHGVLVLACSANVLKRIQQTMDQETPSIVENPRFQALGLPDGQICGVYYRDLRGGARGIANVLGTVGFAASLVPKHRDTEPVIKLGQILTKVARFLRDVNLGLECGGWTQYDPAGHALISRRVVHVRIPHGKAGPGRHPGKHGHGRRGAERKPASH